MENLIQNIKSRLFFNLFTLAQSYLIGGAFIFASLPKVMGKRFTTIPSDGPIGAFFECFYQMPLYWNFLGWTQIVAGILLITQRFALLGALIFLPIILNIFFMTVSLEMKGTPIVTFFMLLSTTWLLIWDFDKWKKYLSRFPGDCTNANSSKTGSQYPPLYFRHFGDCFVFNCTDNTHLFKTPSVVAGH